MKLTTVMLAALCLAGCGCGHAKHTLTFIPAASEAEQPDRAYVCLRSGENLTKDPSGHSMTCIEYKLFHEVMAEQGVGRKTAGKNPNEL